MTLLVRRVASCTTKLFPSSLKWTDKLNIAPSLRRSCLCTTVSLNNLKDSESEKKDRILTVPNALCVSR